MPLFNEPFPAATLGKREETDPGDDPVAEAPTSRSPSEPLKRCGKYVGRTPLGAKHCILAAGHEGPCWS